MLRHFDWGLSLDAAEHPALTPFFFTMPKTQPNTTAPADEPKSTSPAVGRAVRILDLVARNARPLTASELARDTGVSLGKLNYALRALIEQGWVKAGNFGRNHDKLSYAYLLTPSGIEAKARLTRAFLVRKMDEYDRLRAQIEDLQAEIGDGR